MTLPFPDRRDAGRQLANRLRSLLGRTDLFVLGLPRGGVPVAAEVATALGAPLDVFVVRKLGVPRHPEFAMGAIASGGIRVLSPEVLRRLNIPREAADAVAAAEQLELERREREYRLGRPFPDLKGKTVVLIDDGVATGATMLAAIHALRQHGPRAIIAAAPVMAASAWQALSRAADRCEAVAIPEPFQAVGMWYRNFAQTTDEEVRTLLGHGTAVSPTAEATGRTADRKKHYAAQS